MTDRRWRYNLGIAVVDGAAAVCSFDHMTVGLADLGRIEGYLERQVNRWRSQLDSYRKQPGYPGLDIPGVEAVAMWLEANRPSTWRPGLIHGDYQLSNVICRLDRPDLAAIVDWELTTIGDPLLDLGWLLATWPGPEGLTPGTIGAEPWDGFPTAKKLVSRYAERSERDLSTLIWYVVLARFNWASSSKARMHVLSRAMPPWTSESRCMPTHSGCSSEPPKRSAGRERPRRQPCLDLGRRDTLRKSGYRRPIPARDHPRCRTTQHERAAIPLRRSGEPGPGCLAAPYRADHCQPQRAPPMKRRPRVTIPLDVWRPPWSSRLWPNSRIPTVGCNTSKSSARSTLDPVASPHLSPT